MERTPYKKGGETSHNAFKMKTKMMRESMCSVLQKYAIGEEVDQIRLRNNGFIFAGQETQ